MVKIHSYGGDPTWQSCLFCFPSYLPAPYCHHRLRGRQERHHESVRVQAHFNAPHLCYHPLVHHQGPAASLIGRKSPWFWHCRHFAIAVHLFWLVLTTFLGKATSLDGTARASLMYTNSGNLIFPLVASVFGEEYVFYACMYNAVQQFFIWTHGMVLMSGERRVTLRQVLLNINILSVAIGMTLFFFQIILPPIIQNTMGMLASMIGPLSMLVTGMVMAEKDLSGLFSFSQGMAHLYRPAFSFSFFCHPPCPGNRLLEGPSRRTLFVPDWNAAVCALRQRC